MYRGILQYWDWEPPASLPFWQPEVPLAHDGRHRPPSQLSTAPYLTGGHYARSPGTGGKFTAPLPLAIGAMSWALNTLQPSLGATATTSAEKLSVVAGGVRLPAAGARIGTTTDTAPEQARVRRVGLPVDRNGKPKSARLDDGERPPCSWSLSSRRPRARARVVGGTGALTVRGAATPASLPGAAARCRRRTALPPLGLRVPSPFKPPWIYVPIIAILAGQSKTPAAMGGGDKQADFNYRMIYFPRVLRLYDAVDVGTRSLRETAALVAP